MYKKLLQIIPIIAALWAAMSFIPVGKNTKLTIRFQNFVDDNPLKLDSVSYKNALGQSYTVSMFKYYVGNFHLKTREGYEFVSKGYFLINQEDENSMQINIDNITPAEYTAISFTLGIDSIDNCSGAQSGELDPVKGMFWEWNSGYIFLKMEGISPVSNSTGKRLQFHIGGYKEPNNCIKKINLKISYGLKIKENENNNMGIKADLSRLFIGPNPIDFSKISSVTDFHNAKAITDNYSNMFSIVRWQ